MVGAVINHPNILKKLLDRGISNRGERTGLRHKFGNHQRKCYLMAGNWMKSPKK